MTDPIEQQAREALARWEPDLLAGDMWVSGAFLAGYRAAVKEMRDEPELDGTDFAHPAWWRGEQSGVDGAVRNLERGIRGNGVCVHAGLQKQMERIGRLEAERDEALEALRRLLGDTKAALGLRGRHECRSSIADAERVLAGEGGEKPPLTWSDLSSLPNNLGPDAEQPDRPAVTTSPNGVRQTTPSEILGSEKGRSGMEKTAKLYDNLGTYCGFEGDFR